MKRRSSFGEKSLTPRKETGHFIGLMGSDAESNRQHRHFLSSNLLILINAEVVIGALKRV
jgi:hypothetical protein